MAEWFKAADLRSAIRKNARVRTPFPSPNFFFSYLESAKYLILIREGIYRFLMLSSYISVNCFRNCICF